MDVPAGVTQEEGNTGFSIHLLSAVLALIFLARRIQPFLSLVDREVKFCVLTILIVLHPLGIFFLFSRCRKREAHIHWSMVTCKMAAAPVTGATFRNTGPMPADSRQ